MLTAFYFRQHGTLDSDGEQTFEFTHKSFGEYLTATRLVGKLSQMHNQLQLREDNYDEGWSQEKALEVWFETTGETAIDNYLISYIIDEVSKYQIDVVKGWQKTLIRLVSWVLKNGMSVSKGRHSYKVESRLVKNSSEALLIMLSACADKTKVLSVFSSSSKTEFGSLLRTIHLQRLDATSPTVYESLSYIDYSDMILYNQDFYGANVSHSNFVNSSLSFSSFSAATLSYTNLHKANLYKVSMEAASADNANFSFSSFEQADCKSSYFADADFSNADLTETNFSSAELSGANFYNAKLVGVVFKSATLTGANLKNAFIVNADLSEAKGLTHEQLSSAATLYESKLPEGISASSIELVSPDIFSWVDLKTVESRYDDLYNIDSGSEIHSS